MDLTIENALQQAIEAHKAGKLQDAEVLYRAILQDQPKNPDANHNLGVLAVSVNKSGLALPYLKAALEANPTQVQFWVSYVDALIKEKQFDNANDVLAQGKKLWMDNEKLDALEAQLIKSEYILEMVGPLANRLCSAIEHRESGRYQEAQEWLNEFLVIESSDAEAWSLLSQVYMLDRKYAEAKNALSMAISINPDLPSIHLNQARLLLKQAKPTEALEKAQSGYERSVEDPESWLVLSACLGANQRDQEALYLIERVLQARPNYAEAFASRALIRMRANDIAGAIEDAEKAGSIKPHLPQIWGLLGSLRYQNKNRSGAIQALKNALEFEPTNTSYMVELGEILRQEGRVTEAIAILDAATKLDPGNANAWSNLGTAFQEAGEIDNAKAAYENALVINPKSAIILNNIGAIAEIAEDWMSALQYFERATALQPNFAEAHNNLGAVLQKLSRSECAIASYEKAISLKADYAEAYCNLGVTLKELGRLEDAEASYRKAIALKPDFAEALFNFSVERLFSDNLNDAIELLRRLMTLDPNNYGLKAAVNLAILQFLGDNFTASKKLILSSVDIINKTSFKFKNEVSYWKFIYRLTCWHENNFADIFGKVCIKKLYVIGESHSLASHGLHVENFGKSFLCKAVWIVGCKQWHLGNNARNEYKYKFESVVRSLPLSSDILLTIGEIDCRINDGILKHVKQHPGTDLFQLALSTVSNYINYIHKITAFFSHNVTIQGIACPNIDTSTVDEESRLELINLIKYFNVSLRDKSSEVGFDFLDVYELTDRGDGFSNGIWHIDEYHLSPEGMLEVWRRHIQA